MIKVKILGVELSGDFLNPDFREIFEDELTKAAKKAGSVDVEGKRASEAIREQCSAVIDCINNVFGDGSANKVFGDSTDLLKCLDAFYDLCNVQKNYIDPLIKQKLESIKTFQNRQQRRSKKK